MPVHLLLRLNCLKNASTAMIAIGVAVALTALAGCTTPAMQFSTPTAQVQTPLAGNVANGRVVVMGRDGNCLLCHAIPETGARFMGDLGPALSGVGTRISPAQLRNRLIGLSPVYADSIMPAYGRTDGLTQVGQPWRGKPILSAQQIEDVLAYLVSLR